MPIQMKSNNYQQHVMSTLKTSVSVNYKSTNRKKKYKKNKKKY